MSISPISSSMMSMYVPSTVTSASDTKEDYEYQLILQQLAAIGIAATGDKTADKTRLQLAQKLAETKKSEGLSSRQTIPFDDIMNTLNLTITGNLETDYETTVDELDYKISLAYTDEEKAYYQALKDEVEDDYISSKSSMISVFTGASQLGSLNRLMFGL